MEYLGDGITESLINSLSQVPNLLVMSRNAVFRYKGRQADAQAAGKALKVKAVLTGSVVQRGDGLSISAELIEVRSNRHLWGELYNRKLVDILAVQEEISTEISSNLRLQAERRGQKAGSQEIYAEYASVSAVSSRPLLLEQEDPGGIHQRHRVFPEGD